MASRTGTLADFGDETVVAVRVSRRGNVIVRKGHLPAKVKEWPCHHIMSWSLVFQNGAKPTIIDDWFKDSASGSEGTVRVAVITAYTCNLPRIFFCLMHPEVEAMAADFQNPLELYTAIMNAGMPPNELRGLVGDELDRHAFYTAFHDIVPTLSDTKRTVFLHVIAFLGIPQIAHFLHA